VVCETFTHNETIIHRLDPRSRVAVAFAFSALLAISQSLPVLGAGLAAGLSLALLARLPTAPMLKRLGAVNAFLLLLGILLPLTSPGPALLRLGPLSFSRPGAILAAVIALRANGIVLIFTALLSTIELPTLGHALGRLHVPRKLAHLFVFTVRYIEVLHHEYQRLRTAMKVRGFRPRMNIHTCRSVGYLVGMLLVNSLDRSERIMAAMKCRGFRGRFHALSRFSFAWPDAVFTSASFLAFVALLWMELSCPP